MKLRVRAVAFLALLSLACPAWAGLQVQTDFSQQFVSSSPSANGTARLISRDLGISTRWRLSIGLMTRKSRSLELLIGPYLRFPFVFSLSNYGQTIQSPSATELGFDLGISWFSYVRTLVTTAPSWSLTYISNDLHATTDPSKLTQFEWNHWSIGVRAEVPIFVLESDPGDRKVEFGGMISYQLDRLKSVRLTPENFSPSATESSLFNNPIEGRYGKSYRWLVGAFMNFRI